MFPQTFSQRLGRCYGWIIFVTVKEKMKFYRILWFFSRKRAAFNDHAGAIFLQNCGHLLSGLLVLCANCNPFSVAII